MSVSTSHQRIQTGKQGCKLKESEQESRRGKGPKNMRRKNRKRGGGTMGEEKKLRSQS